MASSFNLFNELNDIMNNDTKKFGKSGNVGMVKTGFDCFDYLNGTVAISQYDGSRYLQLGVSYNNIITVIGKSGSGKTTFALQMAYNIIKQFEQGTMFILDFEHSTTENRVKMITGMNDEEYNRRVNIKNTGISTETILNTIVAIKKLKLTHEKELLVDSSDLDENGKPIKILPPTVVIVDSLALVAPADVNESEEMAGQMTATALAKSNTQLFKRVVQPCAEANHIWLA